MKTITVVSHVSRKLGQVTLETSRRTYWKNWTGPVRFTGGAGGAFAALSIGFFFF
jgi:hypothetical protein